MVSSAVVMEEASVGTIELVQSIHCVLAGVAVDDIEKNDDAFAMSHVDQLLQLIWSPVTTAIRCNVKSCNAIIRYT